jgi:hypothetical protein
MLQLMSPLPPNILMGISLFWHEQETVHCPLKMAPFEVEKITGKLMSNVTAVPRTKKWQKNDCTLRKVTQHYKLQIG